MGVVDDFLRYIEGERRYSPLTVRNYRHDIESFIAWCGLSCESFVPEDVDRTDIEGWIVYLSKDRGLKASSVNRSVASLRSF